MLRSTAISAAARAAVCALLVLLGSSAARAQDRELVGRLPASAEMVVVVHDAATVVREALRSPLMLVIPGATVFQETSRAWKRLSERLGWSQDETADRLIGGTCILVLGERPEAGAWAVITTVSGETERRLRERLELAPADIVGGQPVLALKDAELLLAVRRDEALQPGRARLVLLGPAGKEGHTIFPAMLPVLNPPPQGAADTTLAGTGVFAHVVDSGAVVAMYAQLVEGERPRWSEFAAITLGSAGDAISVNLALRHNPLAKAFAAAPVLSSGALEAFAGDAAAAVVACIPLDEEGAAPWRAGAQAGTGLDRAAVWIGRGPARAVGLALSPPGAAPPGPAVIAMLEGRAPGAGDDPVDSMLGGGEEGVARDVRRRMKLDIKPGAGVSRLTGHPVEAAWRTRTEGDWWCAGVAKSGGAAGALAEIESRLTALGGAAAAGGVEVPGGVFAFGLRRWLLWARVDPSLVIEAAPGPWPSGSPTRAILDRVQRLWVGAWLEPDGLIRGAARIEVSRRPAGATTP